MSLITQLISYQIWRQMYAGNLQPALRYGATIAKLQFKICMIAYHRQIEQVWAWLSFWALEASTSTDRRYLYS